MDRRFFLTALCVFVLFFLGCTQQSTDTGGGAVERNEIKIGIVAPLTGGMSTTGNDMWQAATLAADEINAQGGVNVNGVMMQIKLVKGDVQSDPQEGVKAVTKLITEDNVDILVGGFSSGTTYADSVVASENKVPFIITGASSSVITRRTDIDTSYFFHHCPTTDDYAEATLLFVDAVVKPLIYQRFNLPSNRKILIGIAYEDSKFGEGVYSGAQNAIERNNLNMEIVAAEKFKTGETAYQTVLTVLKDAKPDIIYPGAVLNEQSPLVLQGRRDVGMNSLFLSIECNDDPDYYTGVGKWGDYSIQESRFGPYAVPDRPVYKAAMKFKDDFKARFGSFPSMMGASTYEGVYIAAQAIENAGTLDKAAVRDELDALEMPEFIEAMEGGVISFSDDYRESKFLFYMEQLRWNESLGETRPVIVWPAHLKEADFVLPDWYEPGQ